MRHCGLGDSYTVLERVGPTLNEYVKSHVFKKDAFARESYRKLRVIVLNVVKLSQRLHSEGIVHGDINFGNIAFKRNPKSNMKNSSC
jgi:hypothetical protein